MAGGDHGETKKKAFLKIDAAFHPRSRIDIDTSKISIREQPRIPWSLLCLPTG